MAEYLTLKGKISKKESTSGESNGKEWTRTAYIIDNKRFSTFETHDFNSGDEVQVAYKVTDDGKYNNIKNMVLIASAPEKKEEISEEIVIDDKERLLSDVRQKTITLGQSANLAQQYIHLGNLPADYYGVFKEKTKEFYKTMREIQNEVI